MKVRYGKTIFLRVSATLVAAALLCALSVCSASQHDDPSSIGLGRLSVYNGLWKITTTYFRTRYSRPHIDTMVFDTRCWNTPNYYVCNEVKDGKSSRLIVYTYDVGVHGFYAYFVTLNSNHRTSGMKLAITKGVWTYSAKLTAPDGKAVYDHITDIFKGPNAIDFKEEISLDANHWIPMDEGHEIRLRGRKGMDALPSSKNV